MEYPLLTVKLHFSLYQVNYSREQGNWQNVNLLKNEAILQLSCKVFSLKRLQGGLGLVTIKGNVYLCVFAAAGGKT